MLLSVSFSGRKFFLSLVLLASFAVAQAEVPPAPVTISPAFLTTLADEARTNHPLLRAAQARTRAAQANEGSVRTWEDPTVQIGVTAADRAMRADDGDLLYGFEQKLPLGGKPQAARRVARSETTVMLAETERTFQTLRRDIAQNALRIALAERTVALAKEDLAWLDTVLAVAEKRYEIGEVSQADLLRLQNERAQRQAQLEADADILTHERVNLNKWLNRDFASPWPSLQLPAIAEAITFTSALADLAVRNETSLQILHAEAGVAVASVEKARRERRPDFGVGAEIRNYSGTGEFREGTVMLSMTIPWGNRRRYEADIARERARLEAKEQDATSQRIIVRDEVYHLTIEIAAARRQAVLYRDDIFPRTTLALQSTQLAWESGRALLRDVLEVRRQLVDASLMAARATAEQHTMIAELLFWTGLATLP